MLSRGIVIYINRLFYIVFILQCLSILKAALTSSSAFTNGLAHLITEVKEETCNEKN